MTDRGPTVTDPRDVKKAVVRSSWARQRLDAAHAWLSRPENHRALIVAPSRDASDDLVRDLAADGARLFDLHRVSPLILARELAAATLARQGRVPAGTLGREALAARVARALLDDDDLDHFAPVAGFPGFPRALIHTLDELRANGIEPGHLAGHGAAGRDLGRIAEAYAEELVRWRLVDDADLFRIARARVEDDRRHHLLGRPLLLLDLSPATDIERRFLRAVAGRAPSALATVPAGDDRGRRGLESALGCAAITLGDEAEESTTETLATTRLTRLRETIFSLDADVEPIEPGVDSRAEAVGETVLSESESESEAEDDTVVLLRAPGEGREMIELARRVRDLAAAGTPYDRMALVLRDPTRYLPFVEEAFARAKIPLYRTRGARRPHPAGRAFLALLDCAAEGLTASRFAEYLSIGELPATDADGAPPETPIPWVEPVGDQLVLTSTAALEPASTGPESTDPDSTDPDSTDSDSTDPDSTVVAGSLHTPRHWERLLVDAAVVGGHERWRRRLDGLDAELEAQLQSLEDDSTTTRDAIVERRRRLGNLKRFALPLIADLDALPRSADWGRWQAALERLASRALRAPESVLAVLAELRTLADVGPVRLGEVRRTLDGRLRFAYVDSPRSRYGRLFVGTPEDLRGKSFRHVLVPGLAEGMFPRRASEDPLLLDDARERLETALDAARGTLVTQDDRFARERLRLRLAIGAAESGFVVSYPSADIEAGRARVPSFYALDVERASSGRLPDLAQLERDAGDRAEAILGWPAPSDPTRALDEAEFDLATLEPLMRRPGEDDRGAVRYLIDANAHLTRALRRRWQRWRPRLGPADGLVDPSGATREVLAEHRVETRSFSPTALQQYATCPYRFLLYAIHRLRPRETPTALEQLDPLTRGSLFHEVQYRLLSRLRAEDRLPVHDRDRAQVRALADRELDSVAAEFEERLAPAVEQIWRSEIEGLRIDLHGWLSDVVAHDRRWRPAHFELAFGLPEDAEHDPASREEPVAILDGALIRGSIDLVEIDDQADTVRVTDHKTGRASARPRVQIGGGEVLQPLLYGLVAQTLLDKSVESGQLFYCTRRGGFERREVRIDDRGREAIGQVLRTVDRAIENGFFPAAPREHACRYCDFRTVCGPDEERRLAIKIGQPGQRTHAAQATSQQRLAALTALRRMP